MRLAQNAMAESAHRFCIKMFLIVVDSHSKWFEVEIMPSITSEATIAKLRDVFCRYGIPHQLVSDNGSQFTSEECCKFMKANGIKHTLVAPYHPRSNGQAERFVQTFKQFFLRRRGAIRLCKVQPDFLSDTERHQIVLQAQHQPSCS